MLASEYACAGRYISIFFSMPLPFALAFSLVVFSFFVNKNY